MTAGSWIYIGTQGILQGTYETFAQAARKHYGPNADLAGKLVLTAGLGGMGGAQPLAVTMNGGVALCVEVDPSRIERRLETRYLDTSAGSLDEALALADDALRERRPLSIGLLGNAADVYPEMVRRGRVPDMVTDQTSAHDPLNGYVPVGYNVDQAAALRASDPEEYVRLSLASMAVHVRAMLDLQKMGAVVFDYGNNIRQQAYGQGVTNAFDFPGFVPAYIRPLFCEGKGPFRWAALSGDPEDIYKIDDMVLREFADNAICGRWIKLARERVQFQGLPARICWLGYGERAHFGQVVNEMVRDGRAERANRDRPRPPRRRQRSLAQPRDRSDEGRQRRHSRLADPQRADQRRGRRDMGVGPPRRRRRHRLQHTRGPGDRGRRHARSGGAPAESAHHRSRHGHHPPRRRGLRRSNRGGKAVRHTGADAGDMINYHQ